MLGMQERTWIIPRTESCSLQLQRRCLIADRIRKTETSQGISSQGDLTDVIFNNYSGKVKTTRGQWSNPAIRIAGSQRRRIRAHAEFLWLGPHCSNDFLVGAETTEGTGNSAFWGGRGMVVIPSYSSCLISALGELADVGAWECVFFRMMLTVTKQSLQRKTWESKWEIHTGILRKGNTKKESSVRSVRSSVFFILDWLGSTQVFDDGRRWLIFPWKATISFYIFLHFSSWA